MRPLRPNSSFVLGIVAGLLSVAYYCVAATTVSSRTIMVISPALSLLVLIVCVRLRTYPEVYGFVTGSLCSVATVLMQADPTHSDFLEALILFSNHLIHIVWHGTFVYFICMQVHERQLKHKTLYST